MIQNIVHFNSQNKFLDDSNGTTRNLKWTCGRYGGSHFEQNCPGAPHKPVRHSRARNASRDLHPLATVAAMKMAERNIEVYESSSIDEFSALESLRFERLLFSTWPAN